MMAATTDLGANRAFQACEIIYAEMERRSVLSANAYGYKSLILDGVECVFIGSLIALFKRLGYISLATYHNHKSELVAMGCIQQLQKGMFGHTESVWALHH